MDRQKPEWEINVKSMFFSAAYRWKRILVIALALAVLLGAYQAVSAWRGKNNESMQAQYNAEKIKYDEAKKTLEKDLEKLKEDIQNQKAYLEESVFMQLNYWNVHQARVDLYLSVPTETGYQNTDKAEQLLALYAASLRRQTLMEDIAKQMELQPKYLSEVISVSTSLGNILSITVSWPDDVGAQTIMRALVADSQDYRITLSQTVGEHTLAVVLDTVGSIVETSIMERQEQKKNCLEDYERQLAEKEAELSILSQPVMQETSALKAGVKWAIIGGVVGVVLVAALCCLMFIFSDKVYSGADLQARCGVRVLGGMPGHRKLDPVTRCIRRAEGRRMDAPEEALLLLQENLRQYAGAATNILVTGDMKPDQVEACAAWIQRGMTDIKLTACGSVLENVNAVRGLSQCDAVLLLEKCGSSRYHRISREIARINDIKKPLLGCVTVEW